MCNEEPKQAPVSPVLDAPLLCREPLGHGRINYKDTEPLMSAFLKNLPVNGLCGIVFNRFYRLEIHSLVVVIFEPDCELLPPWTKELYLCTVVPLPSL
jgi:hypothetical protein